VIYSLQTHESGLIKIGATKDLYCRLRILRWEYRRPFCVLGIMAGHIYYEEEIHALFVDLVQPTRSRLKASREWFRPDPRLDAFIEKWCKPWEGEMDLPLPRKIPSSRPPFTHLTYSEMYDRVHYIKREITPNGMKGIKRPKSRAAAMPPER
jgi:hypothetical protein